MKIAYLIGYYGYQNFGDEMMLEILVNRLITSGYTKISFESGNNPRLVKAIPVQYKRFDDIRFPRLFRGLINLVRDLRASKPNLVEADLIVFGGGSLLSDSTSLVSLFKILCKLWYAKAHSSRIVSVGLGVGLLKSQIRRKIVANILKQIELVAARDELSVSSLIKCDPSQKEKIQLASDLFYLIDGPQVRAEAKNKGIVGVTVAPPYLINTIAPEQFARAINEILSKISVEVKEVKLIIFQKHDDEKYCDSSYFQKIQGLLNYPAEIFDCPNNIPGALEVISDMNFVIGMRYHSLVLASLVGVPFVGIGTEKKISSLADEFGVKAFTVEELHNIQKNGNYALLNTLSVQETLPLLVKRADKYKDILQ